MSKQWRRRRSRNQVTEKLQKVLARTGTGSRRQVEQWITDGRVKVDGRVAHVGMRVDDSAAILVDNRPIDLTLPQQTKVIAYHKPAGEICTRRDNSARPTVFDNLPKPNQGRWVSVGRLDINTSGLLLFTTDGELANQLMHPSTQIEREYACRIHGHVNEGILQQLREGVSLDDKKARFQSVEYHRGKGANQWYHVVLREGRYREVRRLWQVVGCQVSRLIRIRYGNVRLPNNLPAGHWRMLRSTTVKKLRQRTAPSNQSSQ